MYVYICVIYCVMYYIHICSIYVRARGVYMYMCVYVYVLPVYVYVCTNMLVFKHRRESVYVLYYYIL